MRLLKISNLKKIFFAYLLVLCMMASFNIMTPYAYADQSEIVRFGDPVLYQQQVDEMNRDSSELPWLFAVFFVTWAVFFTYVFVMSQRQKQLRREISALKSIVSKTSRSVHQVSSESDS